NDTLRAFGIILRINLKVGFRNNISDFGRVPGIGTGEGQMIEFRIAYRIDTDMAGKPAHRIAGVLDLRKSGDFGFAECSLQYHRTADQLQLRAHELIRTATSLE